MFVTVTELHISLLSFSRKVSLLVTLVGGIVILGWAYDLELLKSVLPGLVTMKVNTAIGFILIGVSLQLWHSPQKIYTGHLLISQCHSYLAGIVILLALLTSVQYIFKINLGIDELILRDAFNPVETTFPGRMAPTTALNFLLLGLALLLIKKRIYSLAQGFAFASFLISLLEFIGYLYQIRDFYHFGSGTSMALHTSVTFLTLSLGILSACPMQGWVNVITSPYAGGVTARRLLPITISLPLLLGGSFLFAHRIYILPIEVGVMSRSIINILILGSVTWWNARFLNQLDFKQQQTELALRQAQDQLEMKVKERTAELAASHNSLYKSYQLLNSVIEGIPEPVFVKDRAGYYVLANTAMAETLKKPVEEIIGKNDWDLFTSEVTQTLVNTDFRIMHSGKTQVIEEQFMNEDITQTFLSTKTPWRDIEGNVVGLIGVVRDITDRKQAELATQQLNELLEQRVKERTTKLVAANQELETFSYAVSHDLRTPLRSINGFSKALLQYTDQLDDKGKHYLDRIRVATLRMNELIDDLLMLAQITRHEIKHTPVDLSAMVEEIASHLNSIEPEREVEWVIASNIVAIGDKRLLRIVLENLLNNAWKFTSTRSQARIEFGEMAVSEEMLEEISDRTTSTYFVSDNGVGFDMSYADSLFKPFQRLHHANEFPGTGIGLATVQRIIHRHSGRIWATGVIDQGTTFYLDL
ncbi:MAG: PAS domain-containing protein [Cyanobacteria bacterium RM1_2_2]|nr:PAS domain-containing protein [Cyanobacteria bacterium RM1_2_2]